MPRTLLIPLLAIACATIPLARPRAGALPVAPSSQSILRVRSLGEPMTLDWNRAYAVMDAELIRNLMEGLLTLDPSLRLAPALAQSWSVSEDGRTLTFHLRHDVRWSDGVPLKAQQFVDGWKRLLAPVTASNYADLLFDVQGAEYFHKGALTDFGEVGVKALDDRTLKVTLKSRSDPFLYNLAMWPTFPVRQDLVDRYGTAWEKPGNLVTLGAYRLISHDAGQAIVLARNPYYYGTPAKIEQVAIEFIPQDSAALEMYKAGALDLLPRLSSAALGQVRARSDLVSYAAFRTVQLTFNTQHYPLSIPAVRRAIAMAVDRSKFEQFVSERYPQARSLLPPGVLGGGAEISPAFDPVKARRLMTEAGFKPGHVIKLELGTTDFDYLMALAEFVKSELRSRLDIDLTIRTYDVKDFAPVLMASGQFGLVLHDTTAKNPDPDHLMARYLSTAVNPSRWKDPRYDEWIQAARDTSDTATREKDYLAAQKLLLDESVVTLPLYYGQNWALVRGNLHGVRLNPVRGLLFQELSR